MQAPHSFPVQSAPFCQRHGNYVVDQTDALGPIHLIRGTLPSVNARSQARLLPDACSLLTCVHSDLSPTIQTHTTEIQSVIESQYISVRDTVLSGKLYRALMLMAVHSSAALRDREERFHPADSWLRDRCVFTSRRQWIIPCIGMALCSNRSRSTASHSVIHCRKIRRWCRATVEPPHGSSLPPPRQDPGYCIATTRSIGWMEC